MQFAQRKTAYLIAAMLAGSYIGVAVILMLTAAGPFHHQGSPAAAMVSGLTFPIALSLVTVAGGELATSNIMTLPQGMVLKSISGLRGSLTLIYCFMANLMGGIVFATIVFLSGIIKDSSGAHTYFVDNLTGKVGSTGVELFMIFLCLLAFITSGFEHVVANMSSFSLGLWLQVPEVSFLDFLNSLAVVGLGNLVGGAMIGLAYVYISRREVPTIVAVSEPQDAVREPDSRHQRTHGAPSAIRRQCALRPPARSNM